MSSWHTAARCSPSRTHSGGPLAPATARIASEIWATGLACFPIPGDVDGAIALRLWGPSPVLECPLGVQLHECARPCGKRRAAARHRGGLNGLEEFAFGRTMLNGPTHVGQHPLLAGAAIGQDTDDDHLPILDGERLALPDGEF